MKGGEAVIAKGKFDQWLTEDGLLRLEGWARDGLSDEQIAAKMGISPSTFYVWLNKYTEISEAIKNGKAPVDYEVENTMLKTAKGHFVTVKKPMKVRTEKRLRKKDKDGNEYETGVIVEEHIEYVDEQMYIPPNVTAQIFWLKNRRPDMWRDRPEMKEDSEALKNARELLRGVSSVID